jgi:Holliday junction resolvasome RuvABC DNA-binding subunit
MAAERKLEKLVMPVSLEEQLRNLGFSEKAIKEAAESVHNDTKKSETTLNKDLP